MKRKSVVLVPLLAVLLTLSAWCSIPFLIPFTMQTFMVFLITGLVERSMATTSIGVYLLMGVVGLPVFAGLQGGVGVLLGPTGGFIIGFLLMPAIAGRWLKPTVSGASMMLGMLLAMLIQYGIGTLWYGLVYARSFAGVATVLVTCVLPYIIPDLAKCVLVMGVLQKLPRRKPNEVF